MGIFYGNFALQKSDFAPAKKEITSIQRNQIDVIVAYFYKGVNPERHALLTFSSCHTS